MNFIYEIIIFLVSSIAIGIIGNIAGIGGGIFLMIIFMYIFNINPVISGGLSLITIVASTLAGSNMNVKQGAVDKSLFYDIAIAAGVGAILGSIISYFVEINVFHLFFGMVVFCIGLFSFFTAKSEIKKNKGAAYLKQSFKEYITNNKQKDFSKSRSIFGVSFIAGILSGLFGLGIGAVVGTYLTAIKHVHPKIAFSTIVAVMVITSTLGAIVHFMKYGMQYQYFLLAMPLIIGAALGGFTGAKLSSNMDFSKLRSFQSYVVMFFGLLSILISFMGLLGY
ncbi:MAG: sulfite exporter TauE/SafE family protein [Thermoplasmata archaeon]